MRVCVAVLLASCGFSARTSNIIDADGDTIFEDAPADAALDAPSTCLGAWCRRKPITVIAAQVAGGPHTGFPMLLQITADAQLAMHAKVDGSDIRFTLGDNTPIAHQRVRYVAGNGALVAWVRIPALTNSTSILMYYGNSAAPDQQNVAGTWDPSFKGVWHLDEASGGANALRDSTTNANHGTNLGGAAPNTPGQLSNGVSFDGTDDYVEVPNSTSLDTTPNAATFSMWARFTDPSAGRFQFLIISSNAFAGTPDGYSWATQPDGDFYIYPWVGDVNNFNVVTNPLPDDAWRHVAATFNFGNKTANIYVNGVLQTNATTNTTTLWAQQAAPAAWRFGGTPDDAPNYFAGTLDEIRVANVVRSANWLLTEFRNQNNPTGFVTVGGETVLQ
jgi:hypothetical protein